MSVSAKNCHARRHIADEPSGSIRIEFLVRFGRYTASLLVQMIQPVRSALLFAAALTATNIAPAQAGSNSESLVASATVSLPPVAIDELLDPNNQPALSDPDAIAPADEADPVTAVPA